jgi:hypothetical protein
MKKNPILTFVLTKKVATVYFYDILPAKCENGISTTKACV